MTTIKRGITGWLLVAAAVLGLESQVGGQGRERGSSGGGSVRGTVKSVDAGAGTITIATGGGREQAPMEMTYSLAKDVEVASGTGFGRGTGALKEGKVADLIADTAVTLLLSPDKKTVEGIVAEEPMVRGTLKAVDAAKNTLTIAAGGGREQAPEEKTFSVAKDADIAVDDGHGRRLSVKEAKLADLGQGAIVSLRLSIDKKTVHSVLAEGPTMSGTVKELDAGEEGVKVVFYFKEDGVMSIK